jgi:acyl transferase domain-containing protein/NAD(P)H-dependent flavin oxidoreductase YrpB (nitropropane dioxygenase family)/NAD(P)-dependent dehydrogenase (short-subunit alcohol dehydrogenase family)
MVKESSFEIVVLTPAALQDPSVAIAASLAGSLGILDLEYAEDLVRGVDAVRKLARFAKRSCGIKLDARRRDLFEELLRHTPTQIRLAVITRPDARSVQDDVQRLNRSGLEAWIQVTSLAEAIEARNAGAQGLLVKGHESGGEVGDETSFILLQHIKASVRMPFWVQGGVGLHTAAACRLAGATGLVLQDQLALVRESALPENARNAIVRMEGSETTCLGSELGLNFRVFSAGTSKAVEQLDTFARTLSNESVREDAVNTWREEARRLAGWGDLDRCTWLVGQDGAFARDLAECFRTTGGVIEGIRCAIDDHVRAARRIQPLQEHSPLARAHNTRYPIVQGPMTRVSDKAAFAEEVARGGALPFLALALMRAPEVQTLLNEARDRLKGYSWGVGILGFVPADLRKEQLEVIHSCHPPFALIAGGQPEQAYELEQSGIPTYLHVPSPGLLKLFIEQGARRFVFEGRECGGHVGPRSSFVLWDSMVTTLLSSLGPKGLSECRVLFAGGIHDGLSAAAVSAIAAPLAEHGANIGVLVGTAYLFTTEAVATGAIVSDFQQEALRCQRTVLLRTGPGHSTRCADTSYVELFNKRREQLIKEQVPPEEIRRSLEELNLGRLRIAAKGLTRNATAGERSGERVLQQLSSIEQRAEGMYMIGQVAALRTSEVTIEQLHHDISFTGSSILAGYESASGGESTIPRQSPCDVAIVGMACRLPKAPDLRTYWANILHKVDAITEVPADRWDASRYFDADPSAQDKIYSKWGGFLDDAVFDPVAHGIPPAAIPSIEPLQLLTLDVVGAALDDAGYAAREFPRQRTSVILGAGGAGDLGQQYALRSSLPSLFDRVPEEAWSRLPKWTEDSFPGILLNVAAGRVANHFDLGGVNYTVDAACASSLAAVYLATRELESRTSDMVIAGGADTIQNPFAYLCFSKTHALSPRGRCRTFDDTADGIAISEGVAVLVLKRLEDAERDGDRIYAVIKSVSGSSDGRAKGLTAPRPEGQALALNRAYEKASFSPATIGLVEAHGTGTAAGDRAEVETLRSVFQSAGAASKRCAIGSVKSMIGHTKCTAGIAGMVKAALALHHRVLPATLHVQKPNSAAGDENTPFYINTETRPWIRPREYPRRAAVSAFGFGGTNFHAVLEEHGREYLSESLTRMPADLAAEVFVLSARSRSELIGTVERLRRALEAEPGMAALATSCWRNVDRNATQVLALVAQSPGELQENLDRVLHDLQAGADRIWSPGAYLSDERPPLARPKIAFVFPGQGSQYPGMMCDLAVGFQEVRRAFELADDVLSARLPKPLSSYIFPPPHFTDEQKQASRRELTSTEIAQPALGAASMGVFRLCEALNVKPDIVAGHSYGEYVALWAAGVFDDSMLFQVSEARGRCILAAGNDLGTMAAVAAPADHVTDVLGSAADVWIANINGPKQVVLSGTAKALEDAIARLQAGGIDAQMIRVACAFHSPLVAPARDSLAAVLSGVTLMPPRLPVFSNTLARAYPEDERAVRTLLTDHLVSPVRFRDEVEAMYAAGARIFVEAGPRNVLTGLIRQILGDREYLALSTDVAGERGDLRLAHTVAQLIARHVPVNLDRLFEPRQATIQIQSAQTGTRRAQSVSPTAWLVNGSRAVPIAKATNAPAPPPIALTALAEDPPAAGNGASAEQVMMEYQRVMSQFLDTQQRLMLAYLHQGEATAHATQTGPTDAIPDAVGLPAGPPETVESSPVTEEFSVPGDDLQGRLLDIVSERTGYPVEMLDIDADIEAKLGIDSIKRVEIIGAFRRLVFATAGGKQPAIEELTQLKTLRGIVEVCAAALENPSDRPSEAVSPAEPANAPVTQRPSTDNVSRYLLEPTSAPLMGGGRRLPGGIFIVTDDERGIAAALAARVRQDGARVLLVRSGREVRRIDPSTFSAPLHELAGVSELLDRIRAEFGRPASLVHLRALAAEPDAESQDFGAWQQRMDTCVRSLFCLTKTMHADFAAVEQNAHAHLLGATAMGGDFGTRSGLDSLLSVSQGGVPGLIKAMADEWPHVRCKALDFSADLSPEAIADRIFTELVADDSLVEVGYRANDRLVLKSVPANPEPGGEEITTIDPESVIVITGGARGITAEIAKRIARRYRPRLFIVGASEYATEGEPPETANLSRIGDIRAALFDEARRHGPVTRADIDAECSRILKNREIRSNIAAMEAAGAFVRYLQADLSDNIASERMIAEVIRSEGRIDGLIHGAGIVEDRLIHNKDMDSFNRVLAAKADSAFVLTQLLEAHPFRFAVFFSSVSGRFGNKGQCDYCAANEILNKLAARLDRRCGGRVVSIDWGPWAQVGMASSRYIEDQFSARGLKPILPEAGAAAFEAELLAGRKGEVEVILGDGPWSAAVRPAETAMPLLPNVPHEVREGKGIGLTLRIDPERHTYLRDHRIDGKFVFPAAMAMELMAEAAQKGWPEWVVTGIKGFRVLQGIIPGTDGAELRVSARPRTDPSYEDLGLEIDVEIQQERTSRPQYRATVEMKAQFPRQPAANGHVRLATGRLPRGVDDVYREWLFHGATFRAISSIDGIDERGINGTLLSSRPDQCLARPVSGEWIVDPVLLDGALQMAIVWERAQHNMTPLPLGCRSYQRFGSPGSSVHCVLEANCDGGPHSLSTNIRLVDEAGMLVGQLEGMDFSCSAELNRLGGSWMEAANGRLGH